MAHDCVEAWFLLETQVGDVDVEREEEEDAGDGENGDVESISFSTEASEQVIIDVDGGRRRKGGI